MPDAADRLPARATKPVAVTLIALCELGALSLWFSATAIIPSLVDEFGLSPSHASLLTSAVQAGFVLGTLVSAALGLADRLEPRRFFAAATLVAALANGAILIVGPISGTAIALRFLTGVCMAGIYPIGMKMAASWAKGDLGLLVGLLVGALTLGSAAPHLINGLGGIDWRFTIAASSAVALVAALLVTLVAIGPNVGAARPFHIQLALTAWRDKALRYANGGYLGHMWELYAMWAWLGVFLDASFRLTMAAEDAAPAARIATFVVIGIGGAIGCVVGGLLGDRIGRTATTIGAMALSGLCAMVAGLLFGGDPVWLLLLCLVWGAAVIADSGQFSAAIAELAPPPFVGTMLTVQTSVGFLLTLITIHLMPHLVAAVGWKYAFAALALGPAFGIWSMWRLRALPDAVKVAGGRR